MLISILVHKNRPVDHHTTNTMQADGLWIDQGLLQQEMVYNLIKALNIEVTRDIAINLYTAIVTDTGGLDIAIPPENHIITADYYLRTCLSPK